MISMNPNVSKFGSARIAIKNMVVKFLRVASKLFYKMFLGRLV